MGQRSAASADFDHIDHGDRNRHAGPFLEPVGPRNLEHAAGFRRLVLDQANLGRGAAHVKAEHLVQTIARRDMRRENRAASGAAFDKPHREIGRVLDRDDAAAGVHQENAAIHALVAQPAFETPKIRGHQRLDISVGHDRVEAFVFAHLRRNLGRDRHRNLGQAF